MKIFFFILWLAAPAVADEMKPAARALLLRGLRAYDVQKYDDAIEAFRRGYELDPRPDFLYALGQAERLSGDCRRAIEAYRAFLRTEPLRLQARSAEKNLARCLAEANRPPPPAPSPAPAIVVPPILVDNGQAARHSLAAAPRLAPLGSPIEREPPLPPRRRFADDAPGHALLSLGLAGLIAGGALWGIGQGDIDAANSADSYGRFVTLHAAAANAEGERTGGIVVVSLGGALVVAAAIHYAVWLRGR